MASIHKKAGCWYVAYTDGERKRHFVNSGISHSPVGIDCKNTRKRTKENRDKAMIQAIQTEQLAQGSKRIRVMRKRCAAIISSARDTEVEQSGVTLRTYFDRWVAEKLPTAGRSYGNQLRRCKSELYAALETRSDDQIVQVDEEEITEFVVYLSNQKLSGQSINKRLYILDEMFGAAEDAAFVVVNPVTADHFKDESPFERQPLSIGQIELILTATTIVDWHTVTLFGFYCGMRLGDARSQTWEAVDFEKRVIIWIPEKTRRRHQHKAKVIITPINAVLYAHLVKVREMGGDSPCVTPSLVERPISSLSHEFVDFVRAAGIDPLETTHPNGRKVCLLTNHSLRHAFATELKRTGAPEKEWTMLTGHSVKFRRWGREPISLVARMYNHVDVEDLRKWIDLLPALKLPQPTGASIVGADALTNPDKE